MSKRKLLESFINNDKDAIKEYLDAKFETFNDGVIVKSNGIKELWKTKDNFIFQMKFTIEERKIMARKYKGSLKNCIDDHLGKVPIGLRDDF